MFDRPQKKPSAALGAILIVLLLAAIVLGGFAVWRGYENAKWTRPTTAAAPAAVEKPAATDDTAEPSVPQGPAQEEAPAPAEAHAAPAGERAAGGYFLRSTRHKLPRRLCCNRGCVPQPCVSPFSRLIPPGGQSLTATRSFALLARGFSRTSSIVAMIGFFVKT